MAVKVSGAVLASLFYDQSSSNGDQYGFLIGETVQQVKDTISDSQINNVQVETKIYVFDSVPCQREMLYKTPGELTNQHIVNLLPDRHQNIIGWYSFRRNSTLRPSFREKLFHCKLASVTSQDSGGLVFFLCSAKSSTNKSTHTFDHSFLHLDKNIFKKMTVDIINLGDTTHSDYLTIPSHTVSSRHGAFSRIINQQEKDFLNSQGHVEVKRMQNLNKAISKQLQQISRDVIDSESRCSHLEVEVSRLRSRAKLKVLELQQEATNHRPPNIIQETRGPSVDEILCMDQADDAIKDTLMDQVSATTATADDSDHDHVADEENMETETVLHDVIGHKSLPVKQVNTELSAKLSAHKYSSSYSPEGENLLPRHSRSKSTEAVRDMVQGSGLKHNDPFSYVGDILAAESKKSSVKASKVSKNNSTGLDTESSQTSRHASEGGLRSQKTRGQKLKSELGRAGSPQRLVNYENQNIKEKGMHDYRTKTAVKHCGQEASKTSAIEIVTSDDSSSQEMDLTSSPIY